MNLLQCGQPRLDEGVPASPPKRRATTGAVVASTRRAGRTVGCIGSAPAASAAPRPAPERAAVLRTTSSDLQPALVFPFWQKTSLQTRRQHRYLSPRGRKHKLSIPKKKKKKMREQKLPFPPPKRDAIANSQLKPKTFVAYLPSFA